MVESEESFESITAFARRTGAERPVISRAAREIVPPIQFLKKGKFQFVRKKDADRLEEKIGMMRQGGRWVTPVVEKSINMLPVPSFLWYNSLNEIESKKPRQKARKV